MKKPILKILFLFALYKCGYKMGSENTLYEVKDRAIALSVNTKREQAFCTKTFQYLLYGDKNDKYEKEVKKVTENDSLLTFYQNRPSVDNLLIKIKQ